MILERFASLKISAIVLLWLVLLLPWVYRDPGWSLLVLGIGGGVFGVNLAAFLGSSTFFVSRPGLLVFHLALALFLLLAAVGRLTWMEGQVEVATGEAFDGTPLSLTRG
ncbi:MAG: cytochrome c biogenesis protein ResB, partial [Magnetococcales bacterium]|nr:cytochrome c biogenesis protein ResB [Magnetococcales bacterium]